MLTEACNQVPFFVCGIRLPLDVCGLLTRSPGHSSHFHVTQAPAHSICFNVKQCVGTLSQTPTKIFHPHRLELPEDTVHV